MSTSSIKSTCVPVGNHAVNRTYKCLDYKWVSTYIDISDSNSNHLYNAL